MILEVRELKKQLIGLKPSTLIEIKDGQIILVRPAKLKVKKVHAKDVFLLFDMGYAQQQIADEYGVSRQLVHWLLKERETMHESLESNER